MKDSYAMVRARLPEKRATAQKARTEEGEPEERGPGKTGQGEETRATILARVVTAWSTEASLSG
jgi:hypothetical protein